MPLTPFHFGPGLFFGLLLFRFIHLPAFLIANVIIDFEPFSVLFLGLNYPLHGFFHSFLGGSIIAIILSIVMIVLDKIVQKIMPFFKLGQKMTAKHILISSFAGVYLHIVLDSYLYTDITPFFPLNVNPFYSGSMSAGFEMYGACAILLVLGIGLYIYRIFLRK